MSARVELKGRIMPVRERERLKDEIVQDERENNGQIPEVDRDMKKHLINEPDKGMSFVNRRAMLIKKKALAEGTPPSLNAAERASLEKEDRDTQTWLKERMLTKKQVCLTPSVNGTANPEFNRAVNFMSKNEHSQEFMKKAARWKNVRRALRPDDENASNLEFIRPD